MTANFDQLIHGRIPAASPQAQVGGQLTEGVLVRVTAAGAYVTIPSFDGGAHALGPIPWNQAHVQPATTVDSNNDSETHTHDPTPPPVGARCLLVSVAGVEGVRPARWWLVAWFSPS